MDPYGPQQGQQPNQNQFAQQQYAGQPQQYAPPGYVPTPPKPRPVLGIIALVAGLLALVLAIYQAAPMPNGASPAPLIAIVTFIMSIVALVKARRRPTHGGIAAFALIVSIGAFVVGVQATKTMQARQDYQRQVVNCLISRNC
ncbi:hypothetical protein AB0F17_08280 [Nonomuraea sp. NPDC026600]|uniref:hypothetical protein n=1 Tax=Nonomuraea sp. NPDC026600 TaxID=3155363 RepID=UPI0033DBB433